MKKRLIAIITTLLLVFIFAPSIVQADAPILHFNIVGGNFESIPSGDIWQIKSGQISLQLDTILPDRALYMVKAFSMKVADPSGTIHTLTGEPIGTPSFTVLTNGFIDGLIYNISVDGQPANPANSLGGPSENGSFWTGVFPDVITSFDIKSLVGLSSLNFFGNVHWNAQLIQVPAISNIGIAGLVVLTAGSIFWILRRRNLTLS